MKQYKGIFSPLGTTQSFVSFLVTRLIILAIFIATAVGFMILSVPTLFGEGSYSHIIASYSSKEPGKDFYEGYFKYSISFSFDNEEYSLDYYSAEEYEIGQSKEIYVLKRNPKIWSETAPSTTLEVIEFVMGSIMSGAVIYILIMLPIGIIQRKQKTE